MDMVEIGGVRRQAAAASGTYLDGGLVGARDE